MYKASILCASSAIFLTGCLSETSYSSSEDIGSKSLPLVLNVSTTKNLTASRDCILKELLMINTPVTFEQSIEKSSWTIRVIGSKTGFLGGKQIGEILGEEQSVKYYYKNAAGNLGMDIWNTNSSIPKAIKVCA